MLNISYYHDCRRKNSQDEYPVRLVVSDFQEAGVKDMDELLAQEFGEFLHNAEELEDYIDYARKHIIPTEEGAIRLLSLSDENQR